MSITNYVKSCTKVIAGNDNKVFIAPISKLDELTVTTGEISAITLASLADGFSVIEADLDSVGYESTGTSKRGFFAEQTLTMSFSKKTKTLITLVDELRNGVVCGLAVIRRSGNGDYFLSGYAPISDLGGNRPYMSVETTFNTGMSIEESEEGDMYAVSLKRMSATEEYPIDATLSGTISGGTATFINWPA